MLSWANIKENIWGRINIQTLFANVETQSILLKEGAKDVMRENTHGKIWI